MKKTHIIILIAVGIFSFTGAFGVTWFMKKNAPVVPDVTVVKDGETADIDSEKTENFELTSKSGETVNGMTEKNLQNLIYDIREKLNDYHYREKHLDEQEKRIETARKALQEDIDQLNTLFIQITAVLSNLKQKEADIKNSLIEIDTIERENIKRIAKRYDAMEPSEATKIFINMNNSNQLDDVVMIINYMKPKKSAGVLGEFAKNPKTTELAGIVSIKMKQIKEIQ